MDKEETKPQEKKTNFIAPSLAILTTLGVFAMFYFFTRADCAAPKEITFYILGAATNYMTTILTYYFGSSQSSAQKNELLAQQGENRRLETK